MSHGIDYLTLKPARVLNVAQHLWLEETPVDKRQQVLDELTGRFRTMGKPLSLDERNAPAWWHGDEEAYESTMAAMSRLPTRRR